MNVDFDGSRKELSWAEEPKVASLMNEAGVSVTSTKSKLRVFQKHFEQLGIE